MRTLEFVTRYRGWCYGRATRLEEVMPRRWRFGNSGGAHESAGSVRSVSGVHRIDGVPPVGADETVAGAVHGVAARLQVGERATRTLLLQRRAQLVLGLLDRFHRPFVGGQYDAHRRHAS